MFNFNYFFLVLFLQTNFLSTLCNGWILNQNQQHCASLYRNAGYKGEELTVRNGQDLLDLSENYITPVETWNNITSSLKVRKGCFLSTCGDSYLNGNCSSYVEDAPDLKDWDDHISSLRCSCPSNCETNKCGSVNLRKNICGRAFLEDGCNTCKGVFIDMKAVEKTFIGTNDNQIKSIVIRKGCHFTAFGERDFEGTVTELKEGAHKKWEGTLASYNCTCNETPIEVELNQTQQIAFPDAPPMVNVPLKAEEITAMIGGSTGRHKGLIASLRSIKNGRSPRNAYILLLGMTGSGKSATVNFLFDNVTIADVGDYKSTTSAIHEYSIPIPLDELGIANSELRVIDTPGLGDTRGLEADAQFLATLDNYLEKHEELKGRIPNVVLIFSRFNENRVHGEGSNFVKMLRGIDLFRKRLFNTKYSNAIIVLTHLMSATRKDTRHAQTRMKMFKQIVEEFSLFPKPITVTVGENKPEEQELPMINGFYKLPNGDYYPRNLFEKIQESCANGGDPIGEAIIRTGFKSPEKFNVRKVKSELVGTDHSKVAHYLGILSAGNYKVEETEVSNLLAKTYESMDAGLKRKFPDTLPYLQRSLNIRNIFTKEHIPRTTVGIIQLFKDLRQTPAITELLEKALDIVVPSLEINHFTGHSYDVIRDLVLPASPFQSGGPKLISDIGYLLPNIMSCQVENEIVNVFRTFDSKDEYYKARLNSLAVDQGVILKNLEGNLKSGYNLLDGTTKSYGALREHRLFQLILNEQADLAPEFVTSVKSLPSFNSSDYDIVEKWKTFFRKYGTHVVKSAHGGGEIEIMMKKPENKTITAEAIGDAMFQVIQFTDDALIGIHEQSSESFLKNNSQTISLNFRGGDYRFHTNDLSRLGLGDSIKLLDNWQESLILQPIMLQTTLKLIPISEIAKRVSPDSSLQIATAAEDLFNASLIYVPPPTRPEAPPAREDTKMLETIITSYNTQMERVLKAFQDESTRSNAEFLKLHEAMRQDNIRRDENTVKVHLESVRQFQEQIRIMREENERRELENNRLHEERLKTMNEQIEVIREESERRAAESERAHQERTRLAELQIQTMREDSLRREEIDKQRFQDMMQSNQQQMTTLMQQIQQMQAQQQRSSGGNFFDKLVEMAPAIITAVSASAAG